MIGYQINVNLKIEISIEVFNINYINISLNHINTTPTT